MNDNIWVRDEPDGPCKKICVIHPDAKICIGCLRTLPEISSWSQLSTKERKEITDQLDARAPKLKSKRRGRSRRVEC